MDLLTFLILIDVTVLLGGSSEYPQFMIWSQNKKNNVDPFNLIFRISRISVTRTCYRDENQNNVFSDKIILNLNQTRFIAMFYYQKDGKSLKMG